MNNHSGALGFQAYIERNQFQKDLETIKKQLSGLSSHAVKEADKMDRTFRDLGRLGAGAFTGLQLSSVVQEIVRVRGEFQQLEISFNTMLGSKAKADKLMADVTKFAAQTPYGLSETANASKILIAYGADVETVIDRLRKLGDIAAGVGAPLGELTKVYGQVMVNGRMETERLNQFLDRGVPMISELAKVLGVADSQVKKMVEEGKVGFPQLEQAIDNLTKKGAMFGGLMAEQSKSLVGLQSQLGDAVDAMLNDLGKSSEGIATTLFQSAITAVENYEKVVDVMKVVVSAYGAYRAALMLTAAYQNRANIAALVNGYIELAKGLRNAAAAQALLNRTTLANPYVLAATALGALVAGFVVYNKEADEATRLTERISDSINAETSKVQALTSQVKDNALSQGHRAEKLNELIALSPDHLKGLNLENVATAEGSKLIDSYVESLAKKIKLQEYEKSLTDSIQRQNDAKAGKNKLSFGSRILTAMETAGNPYDPNAGQSYMNRLKEKEIELNETIDKQETERQDRIKDMIREITTGEKPTKKPFVPTTPTGDAKKAADKEKEIRIKTFQDELDEKRGMYELYERWVQHVGREAAEEQFQELRKGGENYVDWLNREISRLEQLRDFQYAGFSDQDKTDLDRLLTERGQLQNRKSGIESFKEDLSKAKEEAESLVEYLQYLEAVQNGLKGDDSILGNEKRLSSAAEKLSTEKALKEDLQAFLREVAGSEQRRADIEARYAQKRAALNKLAEEGKVKDHAKALKAIDAAEKKELEDDKEAVQKKSKEYKAFQKIVEKSQDDLKKADIKAAREKFNELTKGLDKESDLYEKHYADLMETEDKFRNKRIENLEAIANVTGQIGAAMQNLGGDWANIGNAIMFAADQIQTISKAIGELGSKDGKTGKGGFDIKNITSIISLITQLAGAIFDNLRKLSKEVEDFDADLYDFKNQSKLLQNRNLGANHSGNPFISDYSGQIKAGVAQYQDALKQYKSSISDLDEHGNAIVDYRGGFFRRKSKRFVTDDLMKTYPELVDQAGNFNTELAKTLIATNQVDDATKKLLETSIAWADQVESANAQMMDSIVSMTGMIGNDLADAMVNAFKAGEDGAKAMSDVLGGVIESFVKQTVLLDILRPILDDFRQGVKDSYAPGGDGTIIDDIYKLNSELPDAYNIAEQVMTGLNKEGKKYGMSIFEQAEAGGAVSANKGHIQGVTEQTVSVLIGQANATRIYAAENVNLTRISVGHLSGIHANTAVANKYLARLERVETLLDDIRGALKSGRI